METDKGVFESIRFHLNMKKKTSNCELHCVVGLEEGLQFNSSDTLLIIDEADYCLLDEDSSFRDLDRKAFRAIIAVSASLPEDDDYEQYVLRERGFKVFDSKIPGKLGKTEITGKNLDAFLQDRSQDRAKLIFTNEAKKIGIAAKVPKGMRVSMDCDVLEKIRHLTGNDVIIVTSEVRMRGYDYRCKTGINLFLDESLSNERAFQQALGRVGRYHEPAARYHRMNLEPLFKKKEFKLQQGSLISS